ncbi:Uncharacterized protein QTN25_003169 [Entamoeba marina]
MLSSLKRLGLGIDLGDNPLSMFDEEAQKIFVATVLQQLNDNFDLFCRNISSNSKMHFIFNTFSIGFSIPIKNKHDFDRVNACLNVYNDWLCNDKMPPQMKKYDKTISTLLTHTSFIFNKSNKISNFSDRYSILCIDILNIFSSIIPVINQTGNSVVFKDILQLLLGILTEFLDGTSPNTVLHSENVVKGIFSLICECFILYGVDCEEWTIFGKKMADWIKYSDVFDIWAKVTTQLQEEYFRSHFENKTDTTLVSVVSLQKESYLELRISTLQKIWIHFNKLLNFISMDNSRTLMRACQWCVDLSSNMNDLCSQYKQPIPNGNTVYKLYMSFIVQIMLRYDFNTYEDVIIKCIPTICNYLEVYTKTSTLFPPYFATIIFCLKKCLTSDNQSIVFVLLNESSYLLRTQLLEFVTLLDCYINTIQKLVSQKQTTQNLATLTKVLEQLKFYYSIVQHTNGIATNCSITELDETYCQLFSSLLICPNLSYNNLEVVLTTLEHFLCESMPRIQKEESKTFSASNESLAKTQYDLIWKFYNALKRIILPNFKKHFDEECFRVILRILRLFGLCLDKINQPTILVLKFTRLFSQTIPHMLSVSTPTMVVDAIHVVVYYSTIIQSISDTTFLIVMRMFKKLFKNKNTFFAPTLRRMYTYFVFHFFQTTSRSNDQLVDSYLNFIKTQPQNTISLKQNNAMLIISENMNNPSKSAVFFTSNRYGKYVYKCTLLCESQQCYIPTSHIKPSIQFTPPSNSEPPTLKSYVAQLQLNVIPINYLHTTPKQTFEVAKLLISTTLNKPKMITDSLSMFDFSTNSFSMYVSPLLPSKFLTFAVKHLSSQISKRIAEFKHSELGADINIVTRERSNGLITIRMLNEYQHISSFVVEEEKQHYSTYACMYYLSGFLTQYILEHYSNRLFDDAIVLDSQIKKLQSTTSGELAIILPLNKLHHKKKSETENGLNDVDDTDWWSALDKNLVMRRKGSQPIEKFSESPTNVKLSVILSPRDRSNSAPSMQKSTKRISRSYNVIVKGGG